MQFDWLHLALAAATAAVYWLRSRLDPSRPPSPQPGPSPSPQPGPAPAAPALPSLPSLPGLPDIVPGSPFLNEVLKLILAKIANGQPLLAGESALAKQFRHALLTQAPGLEPLFDALKAPTATPSKQ